MLPKTSIFWKKTMGEFIEIYLGIARLNKDNKWRVEHGEDKVGLEIIVD